MSFNVFMEKTPEVEEPKVEVKPQPKVDKFDTISLDSTGKSWADMDDDDDIPMFCTPAHKGMDVIPPGFTKVEKKQKNRKNASNNTPSGMDIKCRGCGKKFHFPQNKIDDYNSRGWNMPKTCRDCGTKKRQGVFYRKIPKQVVNLD